MRTREKDLEKFGDFSSVVCSDEYIPHPAPYKSVQRWENPAWPQNSKEFLHNSLKGAKIQADGTVVMAEDLDGGRVSPIEYE
jgi:hypothetical protein